MDLMKQIVEELGYGFGRFVEQAIKNYIAIEIYGKMWDANDDIVMDILYWEFFDDVKGACEIINMLEEKFGYNEYLHYAIVFRDRYGSR